MGFLTPAFLAGLAALAIPVLVHLTNRPRSETVPFPSLMFLQQIPYRSVRRQSLRNWLLFAMRCLAFVHPRPGLRAALLRPHEPGGHDPRRGQDAGRAPRPVVQHGLRRPLGARRGRGAARARASRDRRTAWASSLFDRAPESAGEPVRRPLGRPGRARRRATRLRRDALRAGPPPGPGDARRIEPPRPRDRPRHRFPEGGLGGRGRRPAAADHHPDLGGRLRSRRLEPRPHRRRDGEGLRVGARARHRLRPPREQGPAAGGGRRRDVRRGRADGAAAAREPGPEYLGHRRPSSPSLFRRRSRARPCASLRTRSPRTTRSTSSSRPGATCPCSCSRTVRRAGRSLYVQRALAIGHRPRFRVELKDVAQLQPDDLRPGMLVVLNDAPPPKGASAKRLREFVEAGGGLLVVLADQSTPAAWSAEMAALLPGPFGAAVDRSADWGATPRVRRLRPSRVRAVPRPAQRRLLLRALLPLSEAGREGRRALPVRRRRGGLGGPDRGQGPRARVDEQHRHGLERPRPAAGVPALPASARAAHRQPRRVPGLAHRGRSASTSRASLRSRRATAPRSRRRESGRRCAPGPRAWSSRRPASTRCGRRRAARRSRWPRSTWTARSPISRPWIRRSCVGAVTHLHRAGGARASGAGPHDRRAGGPAGACGDTS